MKMMRIERRFWVTGLTALTLGAGAISCAAVHAAEGPGAAPPATVAPAATPVVTDPAVIESLDKLEAKGKEIKTLQARISFQKKDALLDNNETRSGELTYVTENAAENRSAKFVVDLTQKILDDKVIAERRQYIFDGIWLVEKQFESKMFMKRQILAPGQKFNPLDMDGPFPVPLGQKRADVLARYDVQAVPSDDAEAKAMGLAAPPLHLKLTPKAGAPGKVRFTAIDLWFDRANLMPAKVHAVDAKDNETNVWLSAVKLNAEPAEKLAERFNVDPPPPAEGWNIDIARQP